MSSLPASVTADEVMSVLQGFDTQCHAHVLLHFLTAAADPEVAAQLAARNAVPAPYDGPERRRPIIQG